MAASANAPAEFAYHMMVLPAWIALIAIDALLNGNEDTPPVARKEMHRNTY
jgi:hypothetical protein